MRRIRFPIMLTSQERRVVWQLARREGVSQASIIRRLLAAEARARGLIDSRTTQQEAEGPVSCTWTALGLNSEDVTTDDVE